MTAITSPAAIEAFRLSTLIRALKLEVNTGMKASRIQPLKVAKRDYGIKARTKIDAIKELQEILDSMGGGE